jgi:PKD-like domain
MKPYMRSLCALALLVVCLPMLANDCPAIQTLTATDNQTGGPILIQWSYSGGQPLTQTITGKDFEEPVALGPGQTQYVYRAATPGEKHLQLTAVTTCGTVTRDVKYHVKQCNIVPPPLTVSATRVDAGATFTASVALEPGHTVEWEIVNGTASSTTEPTITVTAGNAGFVTVRGWVSRGNSCSVRVQKSVQIVPPCAITEPQVYTWPDVPLANSYFSLLSSMTGPGTLRYEVRGAEVVYMDSSFVDVITPASGSFEIDIIISTPTCSRTFTRTFTVTPCEATATVSAGAGDPACGVDSVVVEFTGTGPWWGYWQDGEYFYTETPRIERQVVNPGTYTVSYFYDQMCQGVVTGSVEATGRLPRPSYVIEPIPGQEWWSEMATCIGATRTAQLTSEVPAGAQLVWSIEGGSIVSGQGTPRVEFISNVEGLTNLTASVVSETGCASSYADEYFQTLGVPRATVTVEPSTIGVGGTAIITVTRENLFVGGSGLTSSMGDRIIPLGDNRYEYISTHGGGVATITLLSQGPCGTATATTTLTIDAGNPVAGTATVRAIGHDCNSYNVYAELTGVAPFSGTWSTGQTFVSNEPYALLQPPTGGTYTLVEFRDANGPGTISGEATFDFTGVAKPEFEYSTTTFCPGSIITATLTTPIPEGATPQWNAFNANILSGQGTSSVQLEITNNSFAYAQVQFVGPGICSPTTIKSINVVTGTPQAPQFSFNYPIDAGQWTSFSVILDPNTESWSFENSMGDAMAISYQSGNFAIVDYYSTHGPGTSTVRVYGTTACGVAFEATRELQILPPPPQAMITSEPAEACGANVTVTFTGVPPFTATWGDTGETFTTSESTYTRHFTGPSTYLYMTSVADANRTDGYSSYTYVQTGFPPYAGVSGESYMCVNQEQTYTGPEIPAGWELIWTIEGDNAVIVSGQGTSSVVVKATGEGQFSLMNRFRVPGGCEGAGSGGTITVSSCSTP